jgi:hypothetical protein
MIKKMGTAILEIKKYVSETNQVKSCGVAPRKISLFV